MSDDPTMVPMPGVSLRNKKARKKVNGTSTFVIKTPAPARHFCNPALSPHCAMKDATAAATIDSMEPTENFTDFSAKTLDA